MLSRYRDNTNNEAERDLRPIKVHHNISNLWRTLADGQAWCRIRSYITTLTKHDQPILDNLHKAITGQPWIPTSA